MKKSKRTLTPKLRFPEFRDKSEWEVKTGDSLFDQINDRNPGSGLPVLAITQEHGAIPRDMIDYHVSVTEKSIESYKVVQVGDFIISLRSFQGGIEYSQYHGICSPAYVILRRRTGGSDAYFKHYLKTDRFIRVLTRNLEGLRDGKMISYNQFSELLLPVPSPPEQQKIADCLSSLDGFIAAEGRTLEELRDHKRGLMQQLFPQPGQTQPRLRFPEFRDKGEWEEKALKDLCEILNNRRVPISSSNRTLGPYPYYGASGVVDFVDDYIFDERLVLVGEDGAKWKAFEETAFIAEGQYWVNNHAHVLKPTGVIDILLANYLTMIDVGGYVTGNAPPKLTLAKLKTIPVPVAPLRREQEAIADCLTALDAQIAAQAAKIESLKQHKRGLMQQLFPAPEKQ